MSAIPDHITRAAGIVEILTDETAVTLAALTIRRAICATDYGSLIQDRCDGLIQDHLPPDRRVVTV